MIYTYSFISKSKLQRRVSPQMDTFILQLSNPGTEVQIKSGYYGEHCVTFFDDIYDFNERLSLTVSQAKEITNILDKINNSQELLEVIICCDTGITASGAVAEFMKSRYPKARIHQKIDRNKINIQVLRQLKIANCKGIFPFGSEAAKLKLLNTFNEGIFLLNRVSERSLVENIKAFKIWFKENF